MHILQWRKLSLATTFVCWRVYHTQQSVAACVRQQFDAHVALCHWKAVCIYQKGERATEATVPIETSAGRIPLQLARLLGFCYCLHNTSQLTQVAMRCVVQWCANMQLHDATLVKPSPDADATVLAAWVMNAADRHCRNGQLTMNELSTFLPDHPFTQWLLKGERKLLCHDVDRDGVLCMAELQAACADFLTHERHAMQHESLPVVESGATRSREGEVSMLEDENEQLWLSLEQARRSAARKAMEQIGNKLRFLGQASAFYKWGACTCNSSLKCWAVAVGAIIWGRWVLQTTMQRWKAWCMKQEKSRYSMKTDILATYECMHPTKHELEAKLDYNGTSTGQHFMMSPRNA